MDGRGRLWMVATVVIRYRRVRKQMDEDAFGWECPFLIHFAFECEDFIRGGTC